MFRNDQGLLLMGSKRFNDLGSIVVSPSVLLFSCLVFLSLFLEDLSVHVRVAD